MFTSMQISIEHCKMLFLLWLLLNFKVIFTNFCWFVTLAVDVVQVKHAPFCTFFVFLLFVALHFCFYCCSCCWCLLFRVFGVLSVDVLCIYACVCVCVCACASAYVSKLILENSFPFFFYIFFAFYYMLFCCFCKWMFKTVEEEADEEFLFFI